MEDSIPALSRLELYGIHWYEKPRVCIQEQHVV
jgi:hypothetical protein